MSRAEEFKQKRIHKLSYVLAVLFVISILIAGIIAVDYATVYLSTGEKNINVFSITSGQSGIDIKIMNTKLGSTRK